MANLKDLLSRSHGLLILAGTQPETRRAEVWEELSQRCESLYLVGPLSEKPTLPGPAQVWLQECDLAARHDGVSSVLRRNAHGIHLVGPVTRDELGIVINAGLSGSLCVVEVEAVDVAGALDAIRAGGVDPYLVSPALLGVLLTDAPEAEPWAASEAARKALLEGAPTEVVVRS